MAATGQDFSLLIAHQLKGPIGQIAWALETAEENLAKDDPSRSLISRSGRSAREANEIINNLLNLSRIERGVLKLDCVTVSISELIKNINTSLQRTAAEKSVKIRTEGDIDMVLNTDTPKLTEVIRNILDNAIRYAPEGSEVVLNFRRESEGRADITISDKGPGIPAENQPYIFELATRRSSKKFTGSGIGLYVSRMFIELLGGKISFKSSPQGTTFIISLPKDSCKEN